MFDSFWKFIHTLPQHVYFAIASCGHTDKDYFSSHPDEQEYIRSCFGYELYPFIAPAGTLIRVSPNRWRNLFYRVPCGEVELTLHPMAEGFFSEHDLETFGLQLNKWIYNAIVQEARLATKDPYFYNSIYALMRVQDDLTLPPHIHEAITLQVATDYNYFMAHPNVETYERSYIEGEYYPYHYPPETRLRVSKDVRGIVSRRLLEKPPMSVYPGVEKDFPLFAPRIAADMDKTWHNQLRRTVPTQLLVWEDGHHEWNTAPWGSPKF